MSIAAPFRRTPRETGRWHLPPRGGVAIAALSPLLLLYSAWQITGYAFDRTLIGDVFFYPVSIAASWASWQAAERCRAWARVRRAWLLFAAASFAHLAGDIAQTIYDVVGRRPFPSFADVFYLSFYPFMLSGLLSFPVRRRSRGERVRTALDLAVVALGGSAAVVYLVLGPTAVLNADSAVHAATSIVYPVGDMVLLVGLGSLLMRGSAPSSRRALRLVGSGVALYVLADLIYGYGSLHADYRGGDPVDTLWMFAIAVIAVAATLQEAITGPEQIEVRSERISWLPCTAVAFGVGAFVFSDRHSALFPGLTMTIISFTLVVLVAVRQFLAQRDLLGAQGQLRHQATHDTLTGLPNRLLILDRAASLLARDKRTSQPVAALFVDLDGFKDVNDTFGHAAGDELLRIVGARLRGVVRAGDSVGRLGGDEFVILLDPQDHVTPAELVAERLLVVLRQPIRLTQSGRLLTITASIGIARATRGETPDELLRDADIALYRAKDAGRDRFVVFESEMFEEVEDRLWSEMDLLDAIDAGQLFLEFQPTFDLRTNKVTGVEALVRWNHPRRGVLMPGCFIPLAEETGLVVPIGRWVLGEACHQGAIWHRDGHAIQIAVNVSARQLDDDRFVDDVAETLKATGLPPSALTLEITETALMRDAVSAAKELARLRALGLRLAVDDFGTGYSSLQYLRQFAVDSLKIDRTFVSELGMSDEAAVLVHTLVQLGQSLGLETIGEGIETELQLNNLRAEQCEVGQGFLLSRPLPAHEVEQLLVRSVQAFPERGVGNPQFRSARPRTAVSEHAPTVD